MNTYFNTCKIDSFKLRVLPSAVKILNNSFLSEYQRIHINTGEIEPHINLDKHKIHFINGISFRCGKAHFQKGTTADDCIYFQLNAKMLEQNYFQGINKKNIKQLHSYITSLGIIHISLNDFLNGLVSDVDICLDFLCKQKIMQEANATIYRNIYPSNYHFVQKPFARKDNTGMQFNNRQKATPAKPFVKIYHKSTELENKSFDFGSKYFKPIPKDVGRVEYTIKNSKQKKYLKIHYQTLNDLLSLKQTVMSRVLKSGIPQYLNPKQMQREYGDISPKDNLLLYFINELIACNYDKQKIYYALELFNDSPQKKYRIKKLLDNLINRVQDKEKLKMNAETQAVLRQLGLFDLN